MLLCLLQNAWSGWYKRVARPGEEPDRWEDRVWHRDDWLAATYSSRSGQRLAAILNGVADKTWLDTTTLEVADKPSGVKPPDIYHLQQLTLRQHMPIKWVVACGKQAGKAIDRVWSGPLIKIPHPACRVFSNELAEVCNATIKDMMRTHEKVRIQITTHGSLGPAPTLRR